MNVAATSSTDQRCEDKVVAAATYKKCWFCGGNFHNRLNCPAKNSECRQCGKSGHWAKVCQSKNKKVTACTACIGESSGQLRAISAAVPECLKFSTVSSKINGKVVSAIIDSASSESFIDYKVARNLQLEIEPTSSRTVTLAMTTQTASIRGTCLIDIEVDKNLYPQTKLHVIDNLCGDMILGLDFQRQHAAVILSYGGCKPSLHVRNDHSVCSLTTADVPKPRLFANLRPDATPIATKSREYSAEDQQFIAQEIEHLLSEGIIEPSTSPWRAQIVIVKDELNRHKKRMCVDYSNTVNLYTNLDAYPLPKIETQISELSRFRVFSTFDMKSAYHQIPIEDDDNPYTAFEANNRLYQFTRVPFGVTNGVAVFQRAIDQFVAEEKLKNTFPYLDNITIAGRDQAEHDACVKQFLDAIKRRSLTMNESKSVLSVTAINILGYEISNGTIKPDKDRMKPLYEMPPPTCMTSLKRVLGMFAYYAKWIPKFSDVAQSLIKCRTFPLSEEALASFENLKTLLERASLHSVDENIPFDVECDASDVAISATLNQAGRPVAFMSRSLSGHELHYPAVEKEATAVIEAVRKWAHFHSGISQLSQMSDQIAFMLDN